MYERFYYYKGDGTLPEYSAPSALTYEESVLSLDPDAYWRLGDASGDVTDSSGNSRTLTATGTATYGATGWTGDGDDAITFPGSTGVYFGRGNEAWMNPGTGDFSMAWVMKMSAWPAAATGILAHDSSGAAAGWGIRIGEALHTNRVFIHLDGSTTTYYVTTSAGLLYDGDFHHCVVTWDRSGYASLYVDGSFVDATDISAKSAVDLTNALNLILGYGFPGTLDEVAFWNGRLLTSDEVTMLYAARNNT